MQRRRTAASLTFRRLLRLMFGLALLTVWSCRGSTGTPGSDIRGEMHDVYKAMHYLYSYVWSPSLFDDPSNEKNILVSLDHLQRNFHAVEASSGTRQAEPGFSETLQAQQETLKDIRRRFAAGEKEYVRWRLTGMVENCISCHSRYGIQSSFLGEEPATNGSSFEEQLGIAEFLLASRQVDAASTKLYDLARSWSTVTRGTTQALAALKDWLIIEARIRNNQKGAAGRLETILSSSEFDEETRGILTAWIAALRSEEIRLAYTGDSIASAGSLLKPLIALTLQDDGEASSVELHDNERLVQTLTATRLLHQTLEQPLDPDLRRKAVYFLAVAYAHLPIRSLEVFADLYLERCIREFPGSFEAQRCFVVLNGRYELNSTGSGGVNLAPEDEAKLSKLKGLAFGDGVHKR